MSDNKIINLKTPGASITMLVDRVARAKSNFGQDYVWYGRSEQANPGTDGEVIVYTPEKATLQQLTNTLKVVDETDCAGRYITIERTTKLAANKNPFWNIAFARSNSLGQDEPPKAKPAAAAPKAAAVPDPKPAPAKAAAPDPRPEPKAPPAEGSSTPKPVLTPEEIEAKRAAKAKERIAERKKQRTRIRQFRHQMWSDEATFQLTEAQRLKTLFPDIPFEVNAASVSAATAADFIEFNKRGLV